MLQVLIPDRDDLDHPHKMLRLPSSTDPAFSSFSSRVPGLIFILKNVLEHLLGLLEWHRLVPNLRS